jgi:hypothetical protein
VAAFLVSRIVLLLGAVALVAGAESLVVLALGVHRSQGTLLGTALGLLVGLRLWIAWKPASARTFRVKGATARWWRSHAAWEAAHPLLGAVCDGLVIFTLGSLLSVLPTKSDDLTVLVAAECGGIVFAFSATIGVVATRRSRRQREA